METELKAALIGAVAAVFGSAIFVVVHERYKERRMRGRIASALLGEVLAQTEFICALSRLAHQENILATQETFAKFKPTKSTMFEALADQVPLLGSRSASLLVSCYTSTRWAASLIENLPTTFQYAQVGSAPNDDPSSAVFKSAVFTADLCERQFSGILVRLKEACRAAALHAIDAIDALDEIADYTRLQNDETVIADARRKLERASKLDECCGATAS